MTQAEAERIAAANLDAENKPIWVGRAVPLRSYLDPYGLMLLPFLLAGVLLVVGSQTPLEEALLYLAPVCIPMLLLELYGARRRVFVLTAKEAMLMYDETGWHRSRRATLLTPSGEPVPIRTRGPAVLVIGGRLKKPLPDGSRRVPRVVFSGLADSKAILEIAKTAQTRLTSSGSSSATGT